jgi:photoactive yellow protein
MTSAGSAITFDQPDLPAVLTGLSAAQLDQLGFGVIGFDDEGVVRLYNRFESQAAALSLDRVIGNPIFTNVAPCMNNFMVAQRFEDAREAGTALDTIVDFVLTWRMRPTNVRLRLIAVPGAPHRYVVLERR